MVISQDNSQQAVILYLLWAGLGIQMSGQTGTVTTSPLMVCRLCPDYSIEKFSTNPTVPIFSMSLAYCNNCKESMYVEVYTSRPDRSHIARVLKKHVFSMRFKNKISLENISFQMLCIELVSQVLLTSQNYIPKNITLAPIREQVFYLYVSGWTGAGRLPMKQTFFHDFCMMDIYLVWWKKNCFSLYKSMDKLKTNVF